MSKSPAASIIKLIRGGTEFENVFNPWAERDPVNDSPLTDTAVVRTRHLTWYLEQRVERAEFLLVGEAAGYQGAHFSGIAMTSERILLGGKKSEQIKPEHVFTDHTPRQTSCRSRGFSEPTATIVWRAIRDSAVDFHQVVLWNVFPWHPFRADQGLLSNRRPTRAEVKQGMRVFSEMRQLFDPCTIVAAGRVAQRSLEAAGIGCESVRHPSQGGAGEFTKALIHLLG
jgi:hypothetical protein